MPALPQELPDARRKRKRQAVPDPRKDPRKDGAVTLAAGSILDSVLGIQSYRSVSPVRSQSDNEDAAAEIDLTVMDVDDDQVQ